MYTKVDNITKQRNIIRSQSIQKNRVSYKSSLEKLRNKLKSTCKDIKSNIDISSNLIKNQSFNQKEIIKVPQIREKLTSNDSLMSISLKSKTLISDISNNIQFQSKTLG